VLGLGQVVVGFVVICFVCGWSLCLEVVGWRRNRVSKTDRRQGGGKNGESGRSEKIFNAKVTPEERKSRGDAEWRDRNKFVCG